MAKFKKEHLSGEYAWTEYPPEDPKVSGILDDTHFNACEGHEVLHVIDTLLKEWDLRNMKSGMKIERMLSDLPADVRSQSEVKQWIKEKWTTYKSKDAAVRRTLREKCAAPTAGNTTATAISRQEGGFLSMICCKPLARWWARLFKG